MSEALPRTLSAEAGREDSSLSGGSGVLQQQRVPLWTGFASRQPLVSPVTLSRGAGLYRSQFPCLYRGDTGLRASVRMDWPSWGPRPWPDFLLVVVVQLLSCVRLFQPHGS